MTVGTNALLEGTTARTALVATEGFVDLEELGRQARPDLYRLCAANPAPVVERDLRVAAPERCGPDGVLRELDEDAMRERLAELDDDVEAVAVCLLWGFRHPDHERRVAELAAEVLPDAHVSTSHATAAVFREYERLATTTVDAAVSPLLRRYLARLTERTERGRAARARDHALQRRRGRRLHRRRARQLDGALGPRRRRRGRRPGGPDGRRGGRGGPGHGRYLVRRLAGAGRARGGDRRPRGGRALAGPADDRRAHGGRRRGQRGLARRGRRVARGPALGRAPIPAPPVTGGAAPSRR